MALKSISDLSIGNAYKEIKKMQEAVVFLQEYDISIN